jgi:ferrous iron transport protein A
MPLYLAATGADWKVNEVKGKADVRRHLENLGFVPGSTVSVVAERDGNLIVRVKDARIAISRALASKIMGEEVRR